MSTNWQIKLIWDDPVRGRRDHNYQPPLALGRDIQTMVNQVANSTPKIVINDPSVNSYHGNITVINGQLFIVDKNSSNGTFVNGIRQNQAVLNNNDIIKLGNIEIRILFNRPTGKPIRLRWDEPATGDRQENIFTPPVYLGREVPQNGGNHIILNSGEISRSHALIEWENDQLMIKDQGSTNHTFVNNQIIKTASLKDGDVITIGPYYINVYLDQKATNIYNKSQTYLGSSGFSQPNFPNQLFWGNEIIPINNNSLPSNYNDKNYAVKTSTYVAVGAGLGSFSWVDLLRIFGVKTTEIMALGFEKQPYARYQRLCQDSQIPGYERLRSNSDSCPDNIWGFPSYAWREMWHDLKIGKINNVIKYLWQVFSEPDLSETYTPKSENVFKSIDREANRINWGQIYQYGRVICIRKTNDGRYAIAYSQGQGKYAFVLAKYVHIAIGYPGIKLLDDLQTYREQTGDIERVVNAYENHEQVYEELAKNGGTIILRGRGIVASRIIQRIYELRLKNQRKDIKIIHLMRSPIAQGHQFGSSKRIVKNHQELQPFNWPKACWSGDLRIMLEQSDPDKRKELLNDWGGTTTADRLDWQKIIEQGLNSADQWYNIRFGEVINIELESTKNILITRFIEQNIGGESTISAKFIIDATGLNPQISVNPLLNDLVKTYKLPLNPLGRLGVENNFEISGMRNQNGRIYTAGAMTLGGPYAAVDSFLGLQYAALCAVDSLAKMPDTEVRYLNGLASFQQWLKWVKNEAP
jgi:pSer/pThr/pTyr-binding forkhead associated (FHA) protein